MARQIGDLPHALGESEALAQRFADKWLAVFLDYDGTLTPISDRPEDAVISDGMREAVRRLAERIPVVVVSGRDRTVVQKLMGLDNLIVAGDHGFDIWSPNARSIQREEGASFAGLLRGVEAKLRAELATIPGALVEPKQRSMAVHFRLVPQEQQPRVKEIVDAVLDEHPELKVAPGKMVFEIQPRLDWDKGKAVLYLLKALDLVQRSYLGEVIRDGVLYFNPKALDQLRGLTLPMCFRGLLIRVTLEDGRLRVGAEVDSLNRSVKVGIGDQVREIRSGESYTFDL